MMLKESCRSLKNNSAMGNLNSFYSEKELKLLNFKSLGENLKISKRACFYIPENISIGSNVRIDDFCIFSGHIKIGSYVHISAYVALYGRFEIEIEDFSGLSPKCTVFSASDDFSGDYLIGPTIDEKYTHIHTGKVHIKKYSQVGAGSIILPSVTIGEGVAVGAMSLINKNLDDWNIYAGIPAKKIKERRKNLLKFVDIINKV